MLTAAYSQDNSTMLIEAAKGGHATVVQVPIDYPNSLVGTTALDPPIMEVPPPAPPSLAEIDRVPPPGSDATTSTAAPTVGKPGSLKSALRKNQQGATTATNWGAAGGATTAAPGQGRNKRRASNADMK